MANLYPEACVDALYAETCEPCETTTCDPCCPTTCDPCEVKSIDYILDQLRDHAASLEELRSANDVAQVVGPIGPQGPAGPVGPTGPAGGGMATTDIDTLAELNAIVTDATLDDASNTRPPSAHTHPVADLSDASANGQSLISAASYAAMKTLLSLDLVENTQLSTWPGSANITSLGTISSGTWNGTTIAIADGGTGLTSLGTPLQVLRTNAGGTSAEWATLPGGGDALTANPLSQFAATTSAQLAGVISDETGTGLLVFSDGPTFVAPLLGTPFSGILTNCTGLPIATGVSGLGANVATFLATPSSANLLSALTSSTGTGDNVFATSPILATPNIGTPTAGTLTNCSGLPLTTGVTGTLPVANGGTNQSALGTALQVLRTNAGATDTEWATISAGSGAFTADGDTLITPTTPIVLDQDTGDEEALTVNFTVNKATSGNYTGILVNATETLLGGSSNMLLDLSVGGVSKLRIDNSGDIMHDGGLSIFPSQATNPTTSFDLSSTNYTFIFGGNDKARINNLGSLFLAEHASASADVPGFGQLWVRNLSPNHLMFTDDSGIDYRLGLPQFTTEDSPYWNFIATADADTTSAISTLTTSGATTHHIQVDINGTKAWIAVSTNAPS